MNEVAIPTCARVVHYFPNGADMVASANGVTVVPASVVAADGLNLHLSVQTLDETFPVVVRLSIPHKTGVPAGESKAYWDWPARS